MGRQPTFYALALDSTVFFIPSFKFHRHSLLAIRCATLSRHSKSKSAQSRTRDLMRRSSVSLPTSKQVAHDPYEKPDRYYASARDGGYFAKMKESWLAQSQKSKWLKIGGVAFAVICLLYFFTPSGYEVYNGVGGNSGQSPADDSYGTPKCTKSYSKDKSIVEYVLMIDAGSTGSRIHVYKFNNCGPTPELEGEEFMMTEKSVGGLSKYKDDPVAAAKTLDPLLQRAMDTVPEKLKGCSPIAVKATAGLRMIGEEAADAILKQVRTHLEQDYPFPVVSQEHDGVAIMPGSQEGVYAWITTNYLLKKIGGTDKGETAAVFDLGGGSTQIVFEPTFKGAADGGMPGQLAEGDHKYTLDFGGRHFDLYQHSHLNFGLMAARSTIHETLVKDIALDKGTDNAWMSKSITHPCFAVGMSKEIEVSYENKDHSFNFTGPSEPAPAPCPRREDPEQGCCLQYRSLLFQRHLPASSGQDICQRRCLHLLLLLRPYQAHWHA